jgi:hypothetical protein
VFEDVLREKLASLRPHLDERQWRLLLGAEAAALGYGGIRLVAQVTGVSELTVSKGKRELGEELDPKLAGRVRRPGAGRKAVEVADPGIEAALEGLIEPETRGDPESPLRWTLKSTRKLAEELTRLGHQVSHSVVAGLLAGMGYSLQATRKKLEGAQHPDRDLQFQYINGQVAEFLAAGDPVISVDTKKSELIGAFAQVGREWRPKGEPVEVNTYDFPTQAEGRAIPYGVYDVGDDSAWVSVGVDHDTSVFAVATIQAWWERMGKAKYAAARRLLIVCDGGGSNGSRPWLWKYELAQLAAVTGLEITVCHFPPGTSKWNKVEHRLFSRITVNWRGRPLTSYQTVVSLISNTKTATGLTVQCELDPDLYPTKIKLTDDQKAAIPLVRHDFHGEWNYTIAGPGEADATVVE